MFVGTASNVGKSIVTAAFCRIFKQDGYAPAPFKAQNMSLNSFPTPEGLEIGRAQVTQAEAAGIPCHTDMNPVLLKPTGYTKSQIVLHGKPIGNQTAKEYFNNNTGLFDEVTKAFDRISSRYNPIVMEGAGSISELNLKHRDIVNMRMAAHADAATILVGDIDKGGLFASLYGSIKLLTEEERKLIKGIIINKFRGDISLFEGGTKIIEEITGVPVLGIIPHFNDIIIDEEDSVALDVRNVAINENKINICVVKLPRMSNYTDFAVFEHLDDVNLFYTLDPALIAHSDIIMIPGSKNTIEDLIILKKLGIDEAINSAVKAGKTVIGICGGYQMMGKKVLDPHQVESNNKETEGLGILPVITTLTENKQTVQRSFYYKNSHKLSKGYEIHMGESVPEGSPRPLNTFDDLSTDGFILNDRCWGSYIHGIFDNEDVLNDLLSSYNIVHPYKNYEEFKESQYDKLATLVRSSVRMEKIYDILK